MHRCTLKVYQQRVQPVYSTIRSTWYVKHGITHLASRTTTCSGWHRSSVPYALTFAYSQVFGSKKCDCREQLDMSLKYIQENGGGAVIYLAQEGRGIGLANKVAAYALQVR